VLDFQESGKVRLYVHYAYRQGKCGKRGEEVEEKPFTGLMKDIPAFEIISDPVEFEIVKSEK